MSAVLPPLAHSPTGARPARLLVVDDNASILEVFRKILAPADAPSGGYERLKSSLFGTSAAVEPERPTFQVDLAASGAVGFEMVTRARADGSPYAAAFVDMRMPGWDGLTTIEAMWRADPNVQIVVCTAYSDHGWDEVVDRLGCSDRWLALKKPFDLIEVQQMAMALVVKWRLHQKQRAQVDALEQLMEARVLELSRANHTLRLISRCNEALIHSGGERELLDAVCRRLVEDGNYGLAWVGLAHHDERKAILPGAFAGANDGYLDTLQLSWADSERGHVPFGLAIRENRPVLVRDIGTDPTCTLWRDEAVRRGWASMVAIPLRARDCVLGSLNIYSATLNALDEQDVTLLQKLADDLAYGIANLRRSIACERAERELEYQANYDLMTGLPNRSLLRDRMRQALAHAVRTKRQIATLVLHLDRFQAIREALGEEAGNGLLRLMGERLSGYLRAGDTVAYLSGEDFAIAITDLDRSDDIPPLIFKLMHAVAQPMHVGDVETYTTVSIGISLSSSEGSDVDALLHNAASAARCISTHGGNGFHFYAPSMNERALTRLTLEEDLRRALSDGEFVLHYQPKVNPRSGELTGAESLLRWEHPRRGMVMPADFIPLAEESGLIVPMGAWVVDAACRQLRQWMAAGVPVLPIAVNVSARQFRQKDLAAMIQQALEAHHVAPELIELEVTESALLDDLDTAATTLHELKALGIRLTLDDFGTGCSSLSNLQSLPVDQVKIDRSFVRDVTSNPSDAAICRSVIELAHALQLRAIGEGVETEGQLNSLRRQGCDEVQGYYFSRPLPAPDFADLLRRQHAFALPNTDAAPLRTLLIVDDEPHILTALRRQLRCEGYRVLTADNARDGLELLAEHPVQVVLSDQRMPNSSGTEFLARVRTIYPDTIRIILSGYADIDTVVDAVNRGTLFKFLTKPWDGDVLREQLREAFEYQELRVSTRATT